MVEHDLRPWERCRVDAYVRCVGTHRPTDSPTELPVGRLRPRHVRARRSLSWRREVVSIGAALVVYFGGRVLVEGSRSRAVSNAETLIDLEARLNIDVEASLQQHALDSDIIRIAGNLSYVWLHWPLLLVATLLLFFRDPPHYRQFRNALCVSGSVGLVLFATFPMAPPRFMPGFVGTVSDDARRHYLDYPLSWANQYAAFPSFHVGWTLLACLAVAASVDRRWVKVVAVIPAVLVGMSVVTTGNHYILDSVAGALIALVVYERFGRVSRPRHVRGAATHAAAKPAEQAHAEVLS